ncbi:hypothetical protein HanPSC8_Chr11g0492881 [Helianthus annuus]|nr:hypothetical protein HanPSC8_Chr11g0492881 [Helianthus annuus]
MNENAFSAVTAELVAGDKLTVVTIICYDSGDGVALIWLVRVCVLGVKTENVWVRNKRLKVDDEEMMMFWFNSVSYCSDARNFVAVWARMAAHVGIGFSG